MAPSIDMENYKFVTDIFDYCTCVLISLSYKNSQFSNLGNVDKLYLDSDC